ncbi:uncharacterized protein LOC109408813 [Aedes albopictus]|uniref:F-box domain-containing protein n=1 Tax=Aedes albopictus TaxID=7160 RepID=A0ABM1YVM9_AEDAL|nr:uncharacterized protein LOC109408813 [Aedes albopictus]
MASSDCHLHINSLSNYVLREIFSYLPLKDRKTAALVCRLWEQEAFSVPLLANVQLCINFKNHREAIQEVMQNCARCYRNVAVWYMYPDSFTTIVGILDKFGTTIERFTMNDRCTAAQLKELAERMPNLKRMTTGVIVMQDLPNEPLEFPVLSRLHDVGVRFWQDDVLESDQFDVLRMAPNMQRLSISSHAYSKNVRVFEVLERCSNQLRSLYLYMCCDVFPSKELRFEKLAVLKLRLQPYNNNGYRLYQLFQGLKELKAVHLGFIITKSTLAAICHSCPKLETLDIRTDGFEGGALKCLHNLPNLQIFKTNRLCLSSLEPYKPFNSVRELQFHVDDSYFNDEDYAANLYEVFPNVCSMKIITQVHHIIVCPTVKEQIHRAFNYLIKLSIIEALCPFSLIHEGDDPGLFGSFCTRKETSCTVDLNLE